MIALWAPLSAFALNGFSYVVPCASCLTTSDFVNSAVSAASDDVQVGTFTVSSQSYSRTAYVTVSGTISTWCSLEHECSKALRNIAAVAIDANGNLISSDAELSQIDAAIFGTDRKSPAKSIQLDPSYQTSFINSVDEELTGGISQGLSDLGINVGALPIGTVVTVKFQDGTQALFAKTCQCTDMWHWTGIAYNKAGQRIDRQGNVIGNPNTSGGGGGLFHDSTRTTDGSQFDFWFSGGGACATSTTISIDGVVDSSWSGFVQC
jgi:hypothetical protein